MPLRPNAPSERRFGILFAIVSAIAACFFISGGELEWGLAAVASGSFFLVAALAFPVVLGPLNRLWFGLGQLLAKIVNPLVLGAMFFMVVTPFAMVMRLAGRDELGLRPEDRESYWKPRDHDDIDLAWFERQF